MTATRAEEPCQLAALASALALMLFCGASQGAAQLFKCVEGGRTVYQQQACSTTSEPAARVAAPAMKASGGEAASGARALRPPSPASAASATRRR
jgi:hypothetical protein